VIKAKLGEEVEKLLPRLFPFLFWRRVSPAALTLTGTAITLGAAVAFGRGALVSGALLLLAGGFFDLVDGAVARRNGTSSPFGAFLDSTLDRLGDTAVLVGLMVHYSAVGQPPWVALAGFVLITSVMTSYAKARAGQLGSLLQVGVIERGERVVLIVLGGLTGWMVPALAILAVGGAVTVAQRLALAYRELERAEPETGRGGEHPG